MNKRNFLKVIAAFPFITGVAGKGKAETVSKESVRGGKPSFNGPAIFGARPGNAFFFCPAVSNGKVYAESLPKGVLFDEKNHVVSGKIMEAGTFPLTFRAENANGEIRFTMNLVVGEEIDLTPPMGWNSWYCFSESVNDAKIREVALGMKERGLADFGWRFINVDDCWQGPRGGKFNAIQGNEKFPDMKSLADYIHSLGLRFGLYSSPWISTYAGFRGGSGDFGKEEKVWMPEAERIQPNQVYGRYPGGHQRGCYRTGPEWLFDRDVQQWAEWGVDFVKVDWQPNDVPTTKRMADAMRTSGRDITLSLSNEAPLENAEGLAKLAQLWRVSCDIRDNWGSISRIAFEVAPKWKAYQKPGHWNDLDMLQVGAIGATNALNASYYPSGLTYEEQRTQVTLWSLLSAPLLLSCNIAGMDDATFALLTRTEILALDQDPLGAVPEETEPVEKIRVYRKPLVNGDVAVGVFNLADEERSYRLAVDGESVDLWTGEASERGELELRLPKHGVKAFRIAKK